MDNVMNSPIVGGGIPINDNMPDDLKQALSYLNENGIGLNDKIEVMSDEELNGDSALFEGVEIDEEDEDLGAELEEVGERLNNIKEEEINTSELEVLSVKNKAEELNDTSIILRLVYNNVSFLFT